MKATTWLCPVLTLLCATRLVCTAQRGGYPLDYADSNMIQDDYLLEKRNKPSLSIVNPLDVLRQRLLLEIARRQMKENTRQVELNRAILKNVGKRVPVTRRYQQLAELQQELDQQQQQQQQRQQHQQQLLLHRQHFPNQLDYVPATSIFDFLQRRPAFNVDNGYVSDNDNDDGNGNGNGVEETPLDAAKKSLDNGSSKHHLNGNEIANERNHNNNKDNIAKGAVITAADGSVADGGVSAAARAGGLLPIDFPTEHDDLDLSSDSHDGNFRFGYLYQLHKNRYTKK